MSDGLWYEDESTPEEIAAALQQQREGMSEKERLDLAAYLLEGMEPKPNPATGRTTANAGSATPPVKQEQQQPTSAATLHATLKAHRERGNANAPEDVSAFLTAKLREAGA